MKAILFHLPNPIWWRCSTSTSMSEPQAILSGWRLASPLATYLKFESRSQTMCGFVDGTFLVKCDGLLLVRDEESDTQINMSSVSRFLTILRVICQQPEMPRFVVMMSGVFEIDGVSLPDLETSTNPFIVRKYLRDSALTFEHLRTASSLNFDSIPVHQEMAIDAAEAAIDSNHRAAIILSASAIESCAGKVLDSEYEKRLAEAKEAPEFRFVTIKVNQNKEVVKDPVFLSLRNASGDGGSRFLPLLHECPLYLLGRSLKCENQNLYSKAHSLYRTRNRLTHTGKTGDDKKGLITVDSKGAITALNIANDVFKWFSQPEIIVPDSEMITNTLD